MPAAARSWSVTAAADEAESGSTTAIQRSEAARRLEIRPTVGSLPGVRAPNENDRPERRCVVEAWSADGRFPIREGRSAMRRSRAAWLADGPKMLGRRPTVAGQRRNLTGFACSTRCVPHASRRTPSARIDEATRRCRRPLLGRTIDFRPRRWGIQLPGRRYTFLGHNRRHRSAPKEFPR